MKHKMTLRLISYFSFVILLFSLVVGGMFFTLFTRNVINLNEQELIEQAKTLSSTLTTQCMSSSMHGNGGRNKNLIETLQLMDQITETEIWLVDDQAETIEVGNGHSTYEFTKLPDVAKAKVKEIFKGETVISQDFSSLLGNASTTIGVPVTDSSGQVIAALLLHSPLAGLSQGIRSGLVILSGCLILAILFAAFLATLLAKRFITPLQKMEKTTQALAAGNYDVKTEISLSDEIGSLASHIDELAKKLQEAKQESKNLEWMRQQFITNVSHELRTPVTVLKGSLEVLKEGLIQKPEEIKEYTDQMLQEINHLQRLVSDLLELSRLQNPDFQIDYQPINLLDVITDSVRSMQKIAITKDIQLKTSIPVEGILFQGDYGRLKQLLIIILDNAIKFSAPAQQVEIEGFYRNSQFILTIQDHGSGIASEDLSTIFERFHKEKSQANASGSGLGLAIAQQIASRHQILIEVTSELGKGSCFTFSFPSCTS